MTDNNKFNIAGIDDVDGKLAGLDELANVLTDTSLSRFGVFGKPSRVTKNRDHWKVRFVSTNRASEIQAMFSGMYENGRLIPKSIAELDRTDKFIRAFGKYHVVRIRGRKIKDWEIVSAPDAYGVNRSYNVLTNTANGRRLLMQQATRGLCSPVFDWLGRFIEYVEIEDSFRVRSYERPDHDPSLCTDGRVNRLGRQFVRDEIADEAMHSREEFELAEMYAEFE